MEHLIDIDKEFNAAVLLTRNEPKFNQMSGNAYQMSSMYIILIILIFLTPG